MASGLSTVIQHFARPLDCIINNTPVRFHTYTPLGSLLRRNIEQAWWKAISNIGANIFPFEDPNIDDCKNNVQNNSVETYHRNEDVRWPKMVKDPPFGRMQSFKSLNPAPHNTLQPDVSERFWYSSCEKHHLQLNYFCKTNESTNLLDEVTRSRLQWWKQWSSSPASFKATELSDTANSQQLSITFEFPWGPDTVETLSNNAMAKNPEELTKRIDNTLVHGNVIELKTCLEWATMAYLCDGYNEETREVLHLDPHLAPYKAAIHIPSTVEKRPHLEEVAEYITDRFRRHDIPHLYTGTEDCNFQWYDMIGVPFTVVLDEATLETGILGLRSRDTTLNEHLHVTLLVDSIKKYLR